LFVPYFATNASSSAACSALHCFAALSAACPAVAVCVETHFPNALERLAFVP
jgi:hypothetical protein